jgi:EmrB/QacA subfamily drug resistance transporter
VSERKTKYVTLGTLCFALFMVMLDSTVVNLALPTIQTKLGAGLSGLQWIVDGYILVLAAFLLSGGTLGDMYGRRRAFIGGAAVFTLGSLACALAPSTGVLIGARAVQGLGAALMMPSTLSILTNTFPDPRERAKAIGIWAGVSGLALAIGPLVGGGMVDTLGWQSIFYINIPVGIVAIVLALRFVPESRDRAGRSLDLPGQVLAVVGLGTLTYGLIEAENYGWSSARIVTCFVIAAIALAAFAFVEIRSSSPMLQLKFFRDRTFLGANLVGLIVSFGFFGVVFFLSLFMQQVQGYTPFEAGLRQLPTTLGVMVMAILSGRIVSHIGPRLPMAIGLTVNGTALLLMTTVQADTPYSQWWFYMALTGIGMGLVMSPMTAAIMGSVPPARAGMASATSNTLRQLGSVFGVAVLGTIVTSRFTHLLESALQGLRLPAAVIGKVEAIAGQGGGAAAGASAPPGIDVTAIKTVVGVSFTSAIHTALWICGILVLTGAPIALVMIRRPSGPVTAPSEEAAAAEAAGAQAAARTTASSGTASEPGTA